MVEKPEEKVREEFAKKFDYLPGESKQLVDYLTAIKEIIRSLGASNYYPDAILKKIAKLGINYFAISLKLEKTRQKALKVYGLAEKQVMCGEQINIEKKEMDNLKKELLIGEKEIEKLYDEALSLVEEINRMQ